MKSLKQGAWVAVFSLCCTVWIKTTAADPPTFILAWGTPGAANGQFNYPSGVAVGAAGNVYISDQHNQRIQVFDANGEFLKTWGSNGSNPGQFGAAWDVALDAAGFVYATDQSHSRVEKFDANGGFLTMWGSGGVGQGQLRAPCGIAVDGSGNVFVAERDNNRVQKFDSDGVFLGMWGSRGSGPGQFSHPHGIAVDGVGKVYVADRDNNRVQVFNTEGGFLRSWGSGGSDAGQFREPMNLAVDPVGQVYVSDYRNNRVQVFDPDGNFITRWGTSGTANGQFQGPHGIALDASGHVYVADHFNHRIQKFRLAWLTLTRQPWSQTVVIGRSVTFTVGASGFGDLHYQWYFGDQPIPGALDATFTIEKVSFSDAGNYSVSVTDQYGETRSRLAALVVWPVGVELHMHSHLAISGEVGETYRIEGCVNPTDPGSWQEVGQITLTEPTQVWIDPEPAERARRFYRILTSEGGFLLSP